MKAQGMAATEIAKALSIHRASVYRLTLGNMRQNGVRGLFTTCLACGHYAEVNMDAWPDNIRVPSFGPRMRQCGHLGATARPNRIERPDPGTRRP